MFDRNLYKRSLLRWLSPVLLEWFVIAACMFAILRSHNPVVWVLCTWLVGLSQHGLLILGHDAGHGLACDSPRLNFAMGQIFCFAPFGIDQSRYLDFHMAHHLYINTDKDPEITVKKMEGTWKLPTTRQEMRRRFITDMLGLGGLFSCFLTIGLSPRSLVEAVAMVAFWSSIIGITAYTGTLWIPLVWVLAYLTSFRAVFRLRMYTEHFGTESTHQIVPTLLQRFSFLRWNTWCHDVHHRNMNIPYYRLPEAIGYYADLSDRKSVGSVINELTSVKEIV